MTNYLSYTFQDTPSSVSTFDELPLWSAFFGLMLLKNLELKSNTTVVDLGSGAGFPLLELAGRLGSSCKLYGIDPWKNAVERARQKINNYGYTNVELFECSAEKIPLEDNSVDQIVSNLGINNFENPLPVFRECNRILKPGGKLSITTNLNGHWKLFYEIFEDTLRKLGKTEQIEKLNSQQEHRGTVKSISKLFTEGGFVVKRVVEERFVMKFLNGTAFLNHHFIKLGWLSSWVEIFPKEDLELVFQSLEQNLNVHAENAGGLNLEIPMAFIEGEKDE